MRSVGGEVLALSANSTTAAAPSNESLVVLIDRSARECGLGAALTGQTPNGENGIRVRLEQAEFDKLVVCLGSLQQSHRSRSSRRTSTAPASPASSTPAWS
jgi:type II secretory pathway component PulM